MTSPRPPMSAHDDGIWKAAEDSWRTASEELSRLYERIDPRAFRDAVRMLCECTGRVVTSGVGTSAAAARKIAHTLSCVELPAFFLSPADAVHGGLGVVQGGDIAVLISKGGNTAEVVRLIPSLRAKNVPIIAVTEDQSSTLAAECTLLLRVWVDREADELNMLATTSTLTVIALFDAICISIMKETGFTREQFGIIHPGGAVGERLLKGSP